MSFSNPDSALLSREPWPALGIENYRVIEDGPWGFLSVHADGRFEFQADTTPSREEILARWGSYLTGEELRPRQEQEEDTVNAAGWSAP